ncbi:MAG: HAD-IA family hydrolase [Serpentinimonas sp.]|jgi:HAD superfamily hydrolase (TIGR01509 family)|nr:HAD-IA family hydrolase [Serpentinimonas sp.]
MLSALIFDVDGTLADTEMVHLQAFNHAFAVEGMDWVWDVPTYTRLLEVSGGKERIAHYWREVNGDITDIGGTALRATIDHLHAIKTAAYEQAVLDGAVALRPGVLRLIQAAANASVKMAIATTTSPVNIAALLRTAIGPDWASYFAVVEDASTAPNKKPHPQVYLQTLARLGLPARDCVAFEDSANGLKSARGAGLATVITPNSFTAHHNFAGALRVLPNLELLTLPELAQWLDQG